MAECTRPISQRGLSQFETTKDSKRMKTEEPSANYREQVVSEESVASGTFELISSDILINIMEWLEHDPRDPVSFCLSSKRFYGHLYHIVFPLRIAIVPCRNTPCRPLGGVFFASDEQGKLVKGGEQLLYNTKYMLFKFHRELHKRLHFGRHTQIFDVQHEFGVGLFHPKELEQYWTFHGSSPDDSSATDPIDVKNDTVKVSVAGWRRVCFDEDSPDSIRIGFLCYGRDSPTRSHKWYVKNVDSNSTEEVIRESASNFHISLAEQTHLQNPESDPRSDSLSLHPKAVFNHAGRVSLYDPPSLLDPHAPSTFLDCRETYLKVPLKVWIEDGYCHISSHALSFEIAVPILTDDGMDSTCDARQFLSSLYYQPSMRIDYVIYYSALAAHELSSGGRLVGSPIEAFRNQRLAHKEHRLREENNDGDGSITCFYIRVPSAEVEPSVRSQPQTAEPWYAAFAL